MTKSVNLEGALTKRCVKCQLIILSATYYPLNIFCTGGVTVSMYVV